MRRYYLGIDQGTSGTAVAAFDERLQMCASANRSITTRYPARGRAEQDPAEIVASVADATAEVLQTIGGSKFVAATGLANQGESVVAWSATGDWVSPVILWSDDRGLPNVESVRARGAAAWVVQKTGLPLSPYFSAAKLSWLLQHDADAKTALQRGTLRMGTTDSYLGWTLGGGAYRTDHGTASRTQLLNLETMHWDPDLLQVFGMPAQVVLQDALPELRPSLGDYAGLHHPAWDGSLPWRASVVDQAAALAGNACFATGEGKLTYGTGCFMVANAGRRRPPCPRGLGLSVAWSSDAQSVYAIDGGVFAAGAALRWLGELGVLCSPADASQLAASAADSDGVRFLPALQGLGAPWWLPQQRAVWDGLSPTTTRAHLVRAVLDGIAFRVCDIVRAAQGCGLCKSSALRVDGGLSRCDYLMQRQADLLGVRLECGSTREATVFGVAALAAVSAGALGESEIAAGNPPSMSYEPRCSIDERESEYEGWRRWLERVTVLDEASPGAHAKQSVHGSPQD